MKLILVLYALLSGVGIDSSVLAGVPSSIEGID